MLFSVLNKTNSSRWWYWQSSWQCRVLKGKRKHFLAELGPIMAERCKSRTQNVWYLWWQSLPFGPGIILQKV